MKLALVVIVSCAVGAGPTGGPVVISGRYNKCHSLQLQLQLHMHTRTTSKLGQFLVTAWGIVCHPWQVFACVIGYIKPGDQGVDGEGLIVKVGRA